MAKYVFKVYMENGIRNVVLEELKQADLQDMDRFAIKNGSYSSLIDLLAEKLSVPRHNINRISILNTRKETEFSIAANNKYLKELFSGIPQDQKDITKMPHYKEMKTYLFEKIESPNYEDFFNNVYTYTNQFKNLLLRYANAYRQGMYSEEERINILNLKLEIERKLSEYKNYRGLCICREISERMRLNIRVRPAVMTPVPYKLKPPKFSTIEEKTEKV